MIFDKIRLYRVKKGCPIDEELLENYFLTRTKFSKIDDWASFIGLDNDALDKLINYLSGLSGSELRLLEKHYKRKNSI